MSYPDSLPASRPGKPGANGLTPTLKAVGMQLMISYDGQTWDELFDFSQFDSPDGRTPQLRANGDILQVSTDGETWSDLFDVSALKPPSGRSAQMSVVDGYVSWRLEGDSEWIPLFLAPSQAKDGEPGPANKLKVGTVKSLPPGSAPAVSITGEAPDQTISFSIPAGDEGSPGKDALQVTFEIGTVTTLAAGEKATADISGSGPAYTVNFGLPRGPAGEIVKGEPGQAAALEVGSVTTLQPGSAATVSITGAAPNYRINFGIPSGAKGDSVKGDPGPASEIKIGQVTTGAAAATITGTPPNQVLNLTLPKGDPGAAAQASERVTGTVAVTGQKVAVTFAKKYTVPPLVEPSPTWSGTQMVVGSASEVTVTGCNITVMISTGTLLLNGSPFNAAPQGTVCRMLVLPQ